MLAPSHRQFRRLPPHQKGVALIEALVSILIISIGVLALIGLQARAVQTVSDAKYRSDAGFLANKIIAVMWSDQANFATYNSTGAPGGACGTITPGTNANITNWANEVAAILPGAAANRQRVVVDTATGQVFVTLCWRLPNTTDFHRHEVTARIQNNTP
jgi:type IV pilus assembly protein PilV